jgi:pantetheine-phosphate adenylyltransferase
MGQQAVFPGSFDPVTLGHKDIVQRASLIFEKVYVAIGRNTSKTTMLPFESRLEVVSKVFEGVKGVEVIIYEELTVNLCERLGAKYVVRGLRSGTDFDYERNIALMNEKLNPDIETVFFISNPDYAGISSTIVKEIHKFGGDISKLVPSEVIDFLNNSKM